MGIPPGQPHVTPRNHKPLFACSNLSKPIPPKVHSEQRRNLPEAGDVTSQLPRVVRGPKRPLLNRVFAQCSMWREVLSFRGTLVHLIGYLSKLGTPVRNQNDTIMVGPNRPAPLQNPRTGIPMSICHFEGMGSRGTLAGG